MAESLPFYLQEDDPPAKRAILRAALKLFGHHGLANTSIRDIADESGFTNPALYKHFAGKEELALHLFETCHRRVWALWASALELPGAWRDKLDAYVGRVLFIVDEEPEVYAFLSDSARVLWPKASGDVRRHTMIGLARSLVELAPRPRAARRSAGSVKVTAAALQGALYELAREVQVGVLERPAKRWKPELVALIERLVLG
jgi:AcrR family transcriptional regulator